jgi:L-asparagine transporter-like permease
VLFPGLVAICFGAAIWAGLRNNLFAALAGFAVMVVVFPWLTILVAAAVQSFAGQSTPDLARDVKARLLLTGRAKIPTWLLPMIADFLIGIVFRADRRRVAGLRPKEDL